MKTPQERLETRAFRELKKENIRLKRQLREMKREIRQDEDDRLEEETDVEMVVVPEVLERIERFTCPECGGYSTMLFKLIGRDYYKCLDCGSKGRKP